MKTDRRFIALAFLTLLLSSCSNIQDISLISGTGRSSKPILSSDSVADSSLTDSSVLSTETNAWDGLDYTHFGEQFRNELKAKILATGNKTIRYSENNAVLSRSDKALDGAAGIIPFYHSETASTTSWNKEHVWPNSRGAGESGPGSDPQMLRPTKSSDNSSRGNKFFGDARLDQAGNTWDPASLGYEEARGEAARIIFYTATKYYDTYGTGGSSKGTVPLSLSNNPDDGTLAHTMGRLDRLIQWNNQYPVTAQEKRRNDCLDKEGFSRNPFIDDRDLVNYIWDEEGLRTEAYVPASIEE